jgi:hypothetical protein
VVIWMEMCWTCPFWRIGCTCAVSDAGAFVGGVGGCGFGCEGAAEWSREGFPAWRGSIRKVGYGREECELTVPYGYISEDHGW